MGPGVDIGVAVPRHGDGVGEDGAGVGAQEGFVLVHETEFLEERCAGEGEEVRQGGR